MHIELFTIVVDDYDRAIEFFVTALGFELVEDAPSLTNDGRPKRWVVVRPPGGGRRRVREAAEHATVWTGRGVCRHRWESVGPAGRG